MSRTAWQLRALTGFCPDVQQQLISYCAVSNPFCKGNMGIVWTNPLPLEKNGYGKTGKGG